MLSICVEETAHALVAVWKSLESVGHFRLPRKFSRWILVAVMDDGLSEEVDDMFFSQFCFLSFSYKLVHYLSSCKNSRCHVTYVVVGTLEVTHSIIYNFMSRVIHNFHRVYIARPPLYIRWYYDHDNKPYI